MEKSNHTSTSINLKVHNKCSAGVMRLQRGAYLIPVEIYPDMFCHCACRFAYHWRVAYWPWWRSAPSECPSSSCWSTFSPSGNTLACSWFPQPPWPPSGLSDTTLFSVVSTKSSCHCTLKQFNGVFCVTVGLRYCTSSGHRQLQAKTLNKGEWSVPGTLFSSKNQHRQVL